MKYYRDQQNVKVGPATSAISNISNLLVQSPIIINHYDHTSSDLNCNAKHLPPWGIKRLSIIR